MNMKFPVNLRSVLGNLLSRRRHSENFKSTKSIRVIYQLYGDSGAFKYIDQGFINGYEAVGADVVAWNAKTNQPDIFKLLTQFKPTHFIGFMQEPDREPSSWMMSDIFKALLKYKVDNHLYVAVRSNPSNLKNLFKNWSLDISKYPEAGVSSFYSQPERPTEVEEKLLASGFVDLIRSPICHKVYNICFKNYLDFGLRILEEPHAADSKVYKKEKTISKIDVLYVGGCWPFKWANMEPYITSLKKEFNERFKIFGRGWPDGDSEGILRESLYNKIVGSAKINIALHEPSQVLDFPFAGNERIFKLLAMKCFVISDPNPILEYHFDVGSNLILANTPKEMVEKCVYFLENYNEAEAIKESGYKKVISEHTYEFRAKRLLDTLNSGFSQQIIRYKP